MNTELASKKCKPCEDGAAPLAGDALRQMQNQLDGNWRISGGKQLEQKFEFPDFKEALKFTNHVGEIAEQQGHHPDIFLAYGEVRIRLSTHAAGGLTENDFILAAKINELK